MFDGELKDERDDGVDQEVEEELVEPEWSKESEEQEAERKMAEKTRIEKLKKKMRDGLLRAARDKFDELMINDAKDAGIDYSMILRAKKDLRSAAGTMSVDEVRYLVDLYYQIQHRRIESANQITGSLDAEEPHALLVYLFVNCEVLEKTIASALKLYSESSQLGRWAMGNVGIGGILAAGLLAHIDVTRSNSAGGIWRFAGLDPTSVWEKGKLRPWNAKLKTLCWKISDSFVKNKGRENCHYGHVFIERKELETQRNLAGVFSEQAKAYLVKFPNHKQASIYENGMLPKGHINARAKRYAVKLFLSHYWETGRKILGLPIPAPYPIAHMGHKDKIEPFVSL